KARRKRSQDITAPRTFRRGPCGLRMAALPNRWGARSPAASFVVVEGSHEHTRLDQPSEGELVERGSDVAAQMRLRAQPVAIDGGLPGWPGGENRKAAEESPSRQHRRSARA